MELFLNFFLPSIANNLSRKDLQQKKLKFKHLDRKFGMFDSMEF